MRSTRGDLGHPENLESFRAIFFPFPENPKENLKILLLRLFIELPFFTERFPIRFKMGCTKNITTTVQLIHGTLMSDKECHSHAIMLTI